jgi:protein phosphatase
MRIGRATGLTDTGRRRLRNEDAFVCEPPLFAVTDGMGGAQAGELASRLAAAALEEGTGGGHDERSVSALVHEANARVYRRSLEDPAAAGMGTTATVALVDEAAGTMAVGHVGDSRLYRLRDGALERLTADHSLVGELVRSGRITEDEAFVHPQRAVITRALGTEEEVDVDTLTIELRAGDLYLVCSDGLTTMLRDREVLQLVEQAGAEPDRVAAALVEAANRAGGEDNVTVVVFEIVDGEPEPATSGRAAAGGGGADGTAAPAPVAEPVAAVRDVQHHGAGHGSRALALAAILVAVAAAALLVWLGLR